MHYEWIREPIKDAHDFLVWIENIKEKAFYTQANLLYYVASTWIATCMFLHACTAPIFFAEFVYVQVICHYHRCLNFALKYLNSMVTSGHLIYFYRWVVGLSCWRFCVGGLWLPPAEAFHPAQTFYYYKKCKFTTASFHFGDTKVWKVMKRAKQVSKATYLQQTKLEQHHTTGLWSGRQHKDLISRLNKTSLKWTQGRQVWFSSRKCIQGLCHNPFNSCECEQRCIDKVVYS